MSVEPTIELYRRIDLERMAPGSPTRRSCVRVRPGVYADSHAWSGLEAHERYRVRVHAAAMIHPEYVFAHESAACLLGLPVFGEPRDIHVFDPDRSASTRFGDVVVHTSDDERVLTRADGALVTSLTDTTIDLGRVLKLPHAVAVIDSAIARRRAGRVELSELRQITATQVTSRGRLQLSDAYSLADDRSESPGESVSRLAIRWLGFPTPECQQEFRLEGHLDRVDFWWPEHRVVGEADGAAKYALASVGDGHRLLLAEKEREDRLRRQVRGFARWGWQDAVRVEPLREKLLLAGVPQLHLSRPDLLRLLDSPARGVRHLRTARTWSTLSLDPRENP